MPIESIPQKLYAQCYICHRPHVEKVCHHCGRAICDKPTCKSTLLPQESRFPNQEFKDLGLDVASEPVVAVHCRRCVDKVHDKRLVWRLFNAMLGRNRPPLPTQPSINSVAIAESFHDRLELDAEGKYTTTEIKPRAGELKFSLQFVDRDRARQHNYCRRFRIKQGKDFPFHAGFAVLEGTGRWQQLEDANAKQPIDRLKVPIDTLALQGTANELAFFRDPTSRENTWERSFTYTFTNAEDKTAALPIQIVPTVVSDNTQRTLELIVQLRPDAEFEQARIDEFSVSIPQAAGQIVKTRPVVPANPPLLALNPSADRQVTWNGFNIEPDKAKDRRLSFFIRLEHQLEPTMHLRGKLKLTLKGVASGIKNVQLFDAWGKQRADFIIKRQTRLEIEFDLCLEKLRFQTVAPAPSQKTFPGAILNYQIMNELTRNLTQAGLYVRGVVENPAHSSKTSSHITNQSWHIHGRHYIGAYPIDFNLAVTGQEHSVRSGNSEVKIDLTVRGIVAKPEMQDEVLKLRDHLLDEVTRLFTNSAGNNYQRRIGF